MKKETLTLILALLTILFSCNTNDDDEIIDTLEGKWNLVDVTCACAPVDFEKGDHIWTFDLSEKKLTVVNNKDENLQVLETGSYDFILNNNKITILTVEYDYYFKEAKLYLADRPEADGPLIEFLRD